MENIDQYNFSGKRALIRVDFNVPLDAEGNVTDSTRIEAAKPTIMKVIGDGGIAVLMTHLGRPKGEVAKQFSVEQIVGKVSEILGVPVKFAADCVGDVAQEAVSGLKGGDVLLLENLRFHAGESKGDVGFARQLSELGDVYINDAFGTAHRSHASTAVIAQFFPEAKMFGYLMRKELDAIDKVLRDGQKPITAVLGGSKVSSKITIIENLLPTVNNLIIGGGMAFTFVKAKGGKIGTSIVETDKEDLALKILEKAERIGVKIYLPIDVVGTQEFKNDGAKKIFDIYEIDNGWMGLDCGIRSSEVFNDVILNSKTILWNGPLGVFEMPAFAEGTKRLGDSIAQATALGAFSLVGGGDSVSFAKQYGYDQKVSYVSTGGGAMLESLEGKELPGVAAIRQ